MRGKSLPFQFPGSMAAKDFLVSRVMAEAGRENVDVSETERKMLYFSESYPTLPDIGEVLEAFDNQYDTSEYEKKMAKLIGNAFKNDRQESAELTDQWSAAVRLLRKEDHYFLVMLDQSGMSIRPGGDTTKLLLTAMAIVLAIFLWMYVDMKLSVVDRVKHLADRLSARQGAKFFLGFVFLFCCAYLALPRILVFFSARGARSRK